MSEKKFNAGDFTNGKMGEIFKTAAFDGSCVIEHKQLGKMHLISDRQMSVIVDIVDQTDWPDMAEPLKILSGSMEGLITEVYKLRKDIDNLQYK